MLRTRPPLGLRLASYSESSFDLHVLSTPPAFVLSQNQTLRKENDFRSEPHVSQAASRSKETHKEFTKNEIHQVRRGWFCPLRIVVNNAQRTN